MTHHPVYPRELVAEHLDVPPRLLIRYEARGLIHPERDESGVVGYRPSEIKRVWTVLSLHRDMGVNLAGIEAILRLRSHVDRLQACLLQLVEEVSEAGPRDEFPEPPTQDAEPDVGPDHPEAS